MKNKIINGLLTMYSIFSFFATCIIMIQILNHFGIANNFTGFIILIINVVCFPLICKEDIKEVSK